MDFAEFLILFLNENCVHKNVNITKKYVKLPRIKRNKHEYFFFQKTKENAVVN